MSIIDFSFTHAALTSELRRFLVFNFMNFLGENKDLQEYVEPISQTFLTKPQQIVSWFQTSLVSISVTHVCELV